jgi:hypothetical protein
MTECHPKGSGCSLRNNEAPRSRTVCALYLCVSLMLLTVASQAQAASTNKVLILAGTVTGGSSSIEATEAAARGMTVDVVDAATWSSMTAAQFASYRAIILGDPTCYSPGTSPDINAAAANAKTWGPTINGNIVILGTDPVFHASQGGATVTQRGVDFALAQAGKTGAYITLSCYYHETAPNTPVPLLDGIGPGGFTVTGVGCYNNAHIVAESPALSGLTDANLSNWSCSVHEAFQTWPGALVPLAIAKDFSSSYTASDGTQGPPYILAGGDIKSFPLSLSPLSDSGTAGGSHTVTAQLLDGTTRTPVSGAKIGFVVLSGPNAGASGNCVPANCLTDSNGQVSFTYASNGAIGSDTIHAFYDQNSNGVADVGEPQTTAGMTWLAAAATLHVAAFPIDAILGRNVSGNVALITFLSSRYPSPPASSFTATIKWGDGSTSRGTIVAAASAVQSAVGASGVAYAVQGSHTWSKLEPTSYQVTVTGPGGSSTTATAPLEISPLRPTAFFTANPTNPVQDGIGLFVPADPQPGQLKISQYKWQILDGDTVVDNASTRPTYNAVLAQLAQEPGNGALRQIGINLGILPSDANGGIAGIGGLTDDQVRQVVAVWQAYFPYHIVPHLFDFFGAVGVGLTVTDTAGHTSTQYTQNYAVSRDCLPWGGPLSSWFGGFTVCDTYNGIAAQFGSHRAPDYISFNITNLLLANGGGLLGLNGGIGLVIIPRLISSDPQHAVLISGQAGAGVSTPGAAAGVTFGWLGPPGPDNRPNEPEEIFEFVNGADLFGGFSASVQLWHLSLGLGFTALINGTSGAAGEELGFNVSHAIASVSLGAGETCGFSLGTLSHTALTDMGHLYSAWSQNPPSGSPGALTQQLTTALSVVQAGGVNPLAALVSGLQNCNPL